MVRRRIVEKKTKDVIFVSSYSLTLIINKDTNLYIGRNIGNHSNINNDEESREKSDENDAISSENDDFEDEIDEIPQGIYISSTNIDLNNYINNNIDEFASIRESDIQLSNIARRKRDQNQEKARKFEKIASILRFFQDRCPYCYINDISDDNHLLYHCRQVESQQFKAYYLEYRDNFRKFHTIRNLSAYTRCFLPPSLYKRWKSSSISAK